MFKKAILLLAASLVVGTVHASDQTPALDKRQANQEQRVEKGKETGQLTNREAKRLEHAGDRLEANEAKAKADGVVTRKERARLQREAGANSARIAKQKHDKQGDRNRKSDSNADGK